VLRRTGTVSEEDYIGTQNYQLADGSIVQSHRFYIRELRVGTRIVNHISANIVDKRGELLLGESFLKRFVSVEVDNARHVLVLGSEEPGSGVSASLTPPPPRLPAWSTPPYSVGPSPGSSVIPPFDPTQPFTAAPAALIDLSKIKLSEITRPYSLIVPETVQFIISNAGDRRVSEITIGNSNTPGSCSHKLSDYQGLKKFAVSLTPGDSVVLQGQFNPEARWFCIISAQ
jgi:hypothetical protein